jgi:dolichyl-phosphate-mannose-protein mannosyltransferase
VLQYSQYAGIAPPTPQKSDPPVATIGGEPGGRPPVVVDEQIPVMPIEKEQTTVAFGQAEPGVDIFAGEPIKDIKSNHEVAPSLPVEEKEISSAFIQPSPEILVDAKVEEPVIAAGSSTSEYTVKDDVSIQTHPATEAKVEVQAQKEAQPLDEPAAEAVRAAKELYPEAQQK